MKVQLKNCNNIDYGEIQIKESNLNIKYAINGTGKSTISNAIEGLIQGSLDTLIPFKYYGERANDALLDEHKPIVKIYTEGTGSVKEDITIKSVKIFNDDYVNQYTFVGDDVVSNSFEIYVKTSGYEQKMNEIDFLIKEIKRFFENNEELDNIIKSFELFLKKIVKPGKQKAYSTTSPLYKALIGGNKTMDVPHEFIEYKGFITRPDSGQWASWQQGGNDFFDWEGDHAHCPYCATTIESQHKPIIRKLSEEFSSAYLKDLRSVLEAFEGIKEFFIDSIKEKIDQLGASPVAFTPNEDDLIRLVCDRVTALLKRLQNAKNISFETLKEGVDIIPLLQNNIIDLDIYTELNSEKTQSIVNGLNSSMQYTIDKATELKVAVDEQSLIIRETIEKNEIGINQFLIRAGYQYSVSIEEDASEKKYRMLLKYHNGDVQVKDIKKHLSYGERNAFALALFMYDVIKEKPDLVILDDPISSFDKQKKYAIMDMLFCDEDVTLRGMTIVMLTHDFEPISDVLKIHADAFTWKEGELHPGKQFVQAAFLRNIFDNTTDSIFLEEKRILDSNVRNYLDILRLNCKAADNPISKLIYLRRLKELEMDKTDIWNVLSSFFHKNTSVPVEYNRSTRTYETITDVDKISQVEKSITDLIEEDFVYTRDYAKFWEPCYMLQLFNETTKGYEKLQLFRCISDYFGYEESEMTDKVFAKFINETYHSEMDYILQLDPREFEIVPLHILLRCEEKVKQFESMLDIKTTTAS
ncbi:hypothetical protein [Anaerotignum sp.]|uniref:hypothetical protein n=1 Tax=Anaerotignum sp. TaxID=2039241 RepID=UPI0028B1FE16|nr:hypothetical protein [Anaerotignum sp.]